MLSSPRINDSPTPINAYSIPVTSPLRMAPASSDAFTASPGDGTARRRPSPAYAARLERANVLALVDAVGHPRLAAHGHDVREVVLVLHRVGLLAAQQEVVAHGLMRLAVHPHLAGPVLRLPVLERLDDVGGLGTIRLLDGAQGEARHPVGRTRGVAGRRVVLGL